MIFDEIVLHNFGVYAGRQAIALSSPTSTKPVVLFGGLNGGGKTTLLDGLHLALYGKRAKCSNRGSLAYEEFLRRAMHRQSPADEGAAVEVQFRHRSEGREHSYRVHRSWLKSDAGIRERLEVLKDGKLDRVLTESWNEQVEEFLPIGLSQLFLFDGEKIESLADLENSAQLLGTAIHSLLGLEVVDQLASDLTTLERRKKSQLKSDEERALIDRLRLDVAELENQLTRDGQERASAQNEVDQATKRLKAVEDRFRREGGELFEQRTTLDSERTEVEHELAACEDSLREVAGGASPLLLVGSLLSAVEQQATQEAQQQEAVAIQRVLEERDDHILKALTAIVPKGLVGRVEGVFRADRAGRKVTGEAPYLELSKEGQDILTGLRAGEFPASLRDATRLLEQLDLTRQRYVDLERRVSGIPDESAIAVLLQERDEARLSLAAARGKLGALEERLSVSRAKKDHAQAKLASELERAVDGDLAHDDATRVVAHSGRVRATLGQFRERVVESHVRRIEALVLDSFRVLLRKQSLIQSLSIDPRTFRIELMGPGGHRVEPDRLSAGERQLLAVSLLWGLARASGRPLPAVIDTPLGRLDSTHRSHLVERYFPFASHQVLLLSTDEEIDNEQFDRLKPWVGRSYRLEFDDRRGATQVQPGYFWS